ncbi:hypothetical protein OEZ85_004096 [Tetradesmus obliquus]|uniref:F-box domain-containing protein n=1 Tax=Tetradesmus obliquus TaxID=3088 RepID=A0ABY8UDP3_TETOB|nr:hypothetical protein OEZ85_004096 [Tetradesmus obliquus]
MAVVTLEEVLTHQTRPWLALYGVMLKPRRHTEQHINEEDLAPIQRLLTDELMTIIFSRLGPYTLGQAACVCRQWRSLTDHQQHWHAACEQAYGLCHKDVSCCLQTVRKSFRGSWRRFFLEQPHLRYEGLYVSRNTYIRQGSSEWRRERSCYLVTYFRYFRFFPDGTLLYRTSPLTVSKVAKSMQARSSTAGAAAPSAKQKLDQHVYAGRYVIKGGKLFVIIVYPNSRSTEVRARCNIRGVPLLGAANRLDLEELASFDREQGSSASMLRQGEGGWGSA